MRDKIEPVIVTVQRFHKDTGLISHSKADVVEYRGPGNPYHDVKVTVERRKSGRRRVECIESWGQDQGYEEEHGRHEFVGLGSSLDEAVHDAQKGTQKIGFDQPGLTQALSKATDWAERQLEEE